MSSANRTRSQREYAGWIPTVAGRLSFRHVGESNHPTESIYSNVTTPVARLILGYQKRPVSDSLFRIVTDYITRSAGTMWFAISARSTRGSDEGNHILGSIFIYKAREDWKEKAEVTIRSTVYKLHKLRLSLADTRDEEIETHFRAGTAVLHATADISIDFELHRDGVVYLSTPKFVDSDLEYASLDFAKTQKLDFVSWVANQGYFYLRDIAHRHQHHDPSEDTILTLHRHDNDDVRWRRNVVFSLYFRIIRSKRTRDTYSSLRALGLLAYCKSFKEISQNALKAAATNIPSFNDDSLEESIRASIEEDAAVRAISETKAVNRSATSANARIVLLTLAMIILGVLALFAPEAIHHPPISTIVPVVAKILMPTLEILGLILIVCFVATWQVVLGWKDLLELSNVRRKPTMILYLALALALIGFAGWEARLPIADFIGALMH